MSEPLNLVIQTAFLGDVILSVPTLVKIKQLYPETKLGLVCRKGVGRFLLNDGLIDELFEVEKSNSKSYRQVLQQLGEKKIHHLFCLHRSPRSQFFSARIKAERKIGFSSVLGFWIFDDQVDFLQDAPEAIRQYKILESSDAEIFSKLNSEDFSYLNRADKQGRFSTVPEFAAFPRKNKSESFSLRRVAVFPGSVWETKRWSTEGFSALIEIFLKKNIQVALLGSPAERELCYQIAAPHMGRVSVLAGTMTLEETIRDLQHYDLVVANDSGPSHMAAYADVPVLSLFGPTTSAMGFRPWSDRSVVVENNQLSCRPCGAHGHRRCPLVHHNCMNQITAEQVMAAAELLFSGLRKD